MENIIFCFFPNIETLSSIFLLITTLSLQQETNMKCLKNFKILKTKSRWFFRYCIPENKKGRKKPRSKIGITAVMRFNKNREKISKTGRGDSFLV